MKKINLIKAFFALAISLTLVQCTSDDPIPGPMGAQGAAGINGTNGTNGLDGGNTCLTCHNVDYGVEQPATYAVSGHGTGVAHTGRGGACNACHNLEGYLASKANNWEITSSTIIPTPSTITRIGCTTCHSGGHASAGLAVSGKDAALRTASAHKLDQKTSTGADIIIDYKNNSNNCIHCHQPRRTNDTGMAPLTSGTNIGKIEIRTSFGPHYGNQTALLEGMFASEIPGTIAYPAKGTSVHRTGASCTSCHMGKAKDSNGNHSMIPVLDNCKTCHTGAGVVNFNINGGQTKIKNLMLELAEEFLRLRPADFFIYNYAGTKSYDSALIPTLATKSTNQLEVRSTKYYDPANDTELRMAKAYWNWRYLYQDHSYGLHNPKYAEALLRNSIADLKKLP